MQNAKPEESKNPLALAMGSMSNQNKGETHG